jgi:hypothetical protein
VSWLSDCFSARVEICSAGAQKRFGEGVDPDAAEA